MLKKHCKIVGTLGPSSSDEKTLTELFHAGLDIVRLNFSHGSHSDHLSRIQLIRDISKKIGKNIAILQDLQGPKIRCGQLLGESISIHTGDIFTLQYAKKQTEKEIIPIDYAGLSQDVAVGQTVMFDDGLLSAKILEIRDHRVIVEFIEGGILKPRKGVNFPDAKLSLPAMTEKDSEDLMFGIKAGVDFVALSFVQDPADIVFCKKMIRALGEDTPVIAKIEKLTAVEEIDKIAEVSDGLMVARGDLGVEVSVERVPAFQKRIISAGKKHFKPVIIATQMLESMINNPRATLAEAADVANGVLDGADCLMLSGEVAAGKYPVECVKRMSEIIREVETWSLKNSLPQIEFEALHKEEEWPDHIAIAKAACEAAEAYNTKAIVCLTLTGSIARTIARWRPKVPIIAISPRPEVVNRLSMTWGLYAIQNPQFINTDSLLQDLPKFLKESNLLNSGDNVVITAGIPIQSMLPTNMIKINQIP